MATLHILSLNNSIMRTLPSLSLLAKSLAHRILPITPPSPEKPDETLGTNLGWPEGFFAETAGALADDDSFFRHPQGDYEPREDLNVPA
jgi:hypothetical protein